MQTKILEKKPDSSLFTSYILEKPENFSFTAGQFINVELDIPECDARCNKRNFSLASSPADNFLMITTRRGVSKFKENLDQLAVGKVLNFTGPFGRFVLNEDPQIPAVFLSGGIGITPLHSMIRYVTVKNIPKKISVIYSNSQSVDIPYKNELDALGEQNNNLKIHYTISGNNPRVIGWPGLTGRIDIKMITEIVPDYLSAEFYVCGPSQMVLDLKKILVEMQISLTNIKSEMFTGY